MKKNTGIKISIICASILIVSIILSTLITGRFSALKEIMGNTPAPTSPPETTVQISEPAVNTVNNLPTAPVAVLYDIENSGKISSLKGLGFNSVFFPLNEKSSENCVSLTAKAKKAGLFSGVRADASGSADYIVSFAEKASPDFVIISNADESLPDGLKAIEDVCRKLREKAPSAIIAIEPVYSSMATKELINLINTGCADLIFIMQKGNDASGVQVLSAALTAWNETNCALWVCHDITGASSASADAQTAFTQSFDYSARLPLCRGLGFTPLSELLKSGGKSIKEYIKNRCDYLENLDFSVLNYDKTEIAVDESLINFRGICSPLHELLLNGKKMGTATTGDFSLDCKLKPGVNTFTFSHKDKSYEYKVTYTPKLIRSVEPSGDITVPPGMSLEITAQARKDAEISVSFNGTYNEMKPDISEKQHCPGDAVISDFTTYSASLKIPSNAAPGKVLGKITVKAKYSGKEETLESGPVKISAAITEPNSPAAPLTFIQSTPELLQKFFGDKNYGLGTAQICEITEDCTEIYPGSTTSTHSIPDYAPLLKKTADRVVSTAEYGGVKYYILASGFRVPAATTVTSADGKPVTVQNAVVTDGYIMPDNNIRVVSAACENGQTKIVLDMNRCVPFTVSLADQSYNEQNGKALAATVSNSTAVVFAFSETVSASDDFKLSGSVFTNGSWSVNTASKKVYLTLKLAQMGKFYGFHAEYDEGGFLVITCKNKPAAVSNSTIVLDPGHGGTDKGAFCSVSASGVSYEKDITLSIALKFKAQLEAEGAKVILTRDSDKFVSESERMGIVRASNPDMFISLHCGSGGAASVYGTSAYYYRAFSQPLADAIHTNIVSTYKNSVYSSKSADFKKEIDKGISYYAFNEIRTQECPAVYIDYGFVTNTQECQLLQNSQVRDSLAKATVSGIKKFLSEN